MKRDPSKLRAKIAEAMAASNPSEALLWAEKLVKTPSATVQDCVEARQLAERLLAPDLALAAMEAAARRLPRELRLRFDLAALASRLGYTKKALEHLKAASGLCVTALDHDQLGHHYNAVGENDLAFAAYTSAHELDPENHSIKSNLANVCAFRGETERAEQLFDEVIAGPAQNDFDWCNRSWVRRQTADRNHVAQLLEAYESGPDKGSWDVGYALAKEYEDLGDEAGFIDTLLKASATRRASISYDPARDIANVRQRMDAFSDEFLRDVAGGHGSREPIFIVSMPRAGSTLLEHMLAVHSDVTALGELANFGRALQVKSQDALRKMGWPRAAQPGEITLNIDFQSLGAAYIASTRPFSGKTAHFLDKSTFNFLNCGAIRAALPNARIIHVRRDPMDACFALLKQPFRDGMYYSYDQEELGRYYCAYLELMAYWERVMPGHIIHVSYEDLVQQKEETIRGLIDRLDLPWEDACLDHTAAKMVSKTASAVQVREPVHDRSIGRWKAFATELEPLRQTLEAGGAAFA